MPGLEQMVNALAFDQRARKNRAKLRWTRARFEALDVYSARQIIELRLGETLHPEGVSSFLGKNDEQIGQFVLFQETFAFEEEIFLPTGLGRGWRRRPVDFSAVPM